MSCLYSLSPLTLLQASPGCLHLHNPMQLLLQNHTGIPLGNSNSQLHLCLTWPTVSIWPCGSCPPPPAPPQTTFFLWLPRHYAFLLSFFLPHLLSLPPPLLPPEGGHCKFFGSLVLHAYSLVPPIKSHKQIDFVFSEKFWSHGTTKQKVQSSQLPFTYPYNLPHHQSSPSGWFIF